MPRQPTLQELGQAWKEAKPGRWDDVPDNELGLAFRQAYPDKYADVQVGEVPNAVSPGLAETQVDLVNREHGAGVRPSPEESVPPRQGPPWLSTTADVLDDLQPKPPPPFITYKDTPPNSGPQQIPQTTEEAAEITRRNAEQYVDAFNRGMGAGVPPPIDMQRAEPPPAPPIRQTPWTAQSDARRDQEAGIRSVADVRESMAKLSPARLVSPHPVMSPENTPSREQRIRMTQMGGGAEPFIDPEMLTPSGERQVRDLTRTILNFASPEGIALIAATGGVGAWSRTAGAALEIGFSGALGKQAYDQYGAYKEAMERDDYEEASQHLDSLILNLGFAGAIGAHGVSRLRTPGKPSVPPKAEKMPVEAAPKPKTPPDTAKLREAERILDEIFAEHPEVIAKQKGGVEIPEVMGPPPPPPNIASLKAKAAPPEVVPPAASAGASNVRIIRRVSGAGEPGGFPEPPKRPSAPGPPPAAQPQPQAAKPKPKGKPVMEAQRPQEKLRDTLAEPTKTEGKLRNDLAELTKAKNKLREIAAEPTKTETFSRTTRIGPLPTGSVDYTRVFLPPLSPEDRDLLQDRLTGTGEVSELETGETVVDFENPEIFDDELSRFMVKEALKRPELDDEELAEYVREALEMEDDEDVVQSAVQPPAETPDVMQDAVQKPAPAKPTTSPTTNITGTKATSEESVTSPATTGEAEAAENISAPGRSLQQGAVDVRGEEVTTSQEEVAHAEEAIAGREEPGPTILGPRPPRVAPTQGSAARINIPGEDRAFEARYEVRELDDIYPSHSGVTFQANPDYQIRNDRDYSDERNQERVLRNVAKFNPSFLVNDNPDAVNGPSVIDERGNALGGNSRLMVLQRLKPEQYEQYRGLLKQKASQFGVDDLDRFNKPVLVRVVPDEQIENVGKAVTDLNKTGTAALTKAERAAADSRALKPETLDFIAARIEERGPDATLNEALDASGLAILDRLVSDEVITPQEKSALIEQDGKLSEDAKSRISRMLVGRAFRDAQQLDRTPKSIVNKVARITAPMARVQGNAEWDLTEAVQEAIDVLEARREAKAAGFANLEDYNRQQGMFESTERQFSDKATQMADAFETMTQNNLVKAFRRYAKEEEQARPDATAMMFGKPLTAAEAFSQAFAGKPLDALLEEGSNDSPELIDFATDIFKVSNARVKTAEQAFANMRAYHAGKEGQTGTIYVNRFVVSWVAAVASEDRDNMVGVNIKPGLVARLLKKSKDMAESRTVAMSPEAAEAKKYLMELHDAVKSAFETGQTVSFARVPEDHTSGIMGIRRYVRHEAHHAEFAFLKLRDEDARDFLASPGLLEMMKQAIDQGYSRDASRLAEEIGARLAEGPSGWRQYGIAAGQAVKALGAYYDARLKSGALSPSMMERAHPFAREAYRAREAEVAGSERRDRRGGPSEEVREGASERRVGQGLRGRWDDSIAEQGDRAVAQLDAAFFNGGFVGKDRETFTKFLKDANDAGVLDLEALQKYAKSAAGKSVKIAKVIKPGFDAYIKDLFSSADPSDIGTVTRIWHTLRYLSELYPAFRPAFERNLEYTKERNEKSAILYETLIPYWRLSKDDKRPLHNRLIKGRRQKTNTINMEGLSKDQIAAFYAVRKAFEIAFNWLADLTVWIASKGAITSAKEFESVLLAEEQPLRDLKNERTEISEQRKLKTITSQQMRQRNAELDIQEEKIKKPAFDRMVNALKRAVIDITPEGVATEKKSAEQEKRDQEMIEKKARVVLDALRDLNRSKKEGYVPFTRFGKWFYGIKDKKQDKMVEYRSRSTPWTALYDLNELTSRHRAKIKSGEYGVVKVKKKDSLFPEVFEGLGGLELSILMKMAKVDPEIAEAVENMRDTLRKGGFPAHFTKSSEVKGFEGDLTRPIADYVQGVTNHIAKAKMMMDMKKIIADMPQDHTKLIKVAQAMVEYNTKPRFEFAFVRGLISHLFLGRAKITPAIVNRYQIPMMTYPWLTQYGSDVQVANELRKAETEVLKSVSAETQWRRGTFFDISKLPEDVREPVKKSIEDGLLRAQIVEELAAQAKNTLGAWQFLSKGSFVFFSASEQANRITSFIAAYRIYQQNIGKAKKVARKKGESFRHGRFLSEFGKPLDKSLSKEEYKKRKDENAFEFAEDVVAITQIEYGKENKPMMMRGITAPLFIFMQYPVGFAEMRIRLIRSWVNAQESALKELAPPKEGSAAGGKPPKPPGGDDPPPIDFIDPEGDRFRPSRLPLYKRTAIQRLTLLEYAAGGMLGLWGMKFLFDAIDIGYKAVTDEEMDLALEMQLWLAGLTDNPEFGALMADTHMNGPMRQILPMELSERVTQGDPSGGMLEAIKRGDWTQGFALFSAPRQLDPDTLSFLYGGDGWIDYVKAISPIEPVGSALKAYKAHKEGPTDWRGRPTELPGGRREYTGLELALKSMGWYLKSEADARTKKDLNRLYESAIKDVRQHFLDQLTIAGIRNDQEMIARILQDINAWNNERRLFGIAAPRSHQLGKVLIEPKDVVANAQRFNTPEFIRDLQSIPLNLRQEYLDRLKLLPGQAKHPIYDNQ